MWSLITLSVGVFSQSCPTYSCHEGGFDISPICGMLSDTNDIVLQVCDQPFQGFCDVTGTITKNYTCVNSPPFNFPQAYPGEYCRSNSDCITNQCVSGYCAGQGAGGTCTGNSDCNVGYYCSAGFYCTPQVSYGQSCTHDFMCANNLACNRTLFEDGTCVYYFSLPLGGKVGMCIDMLTEGISNLCSTGTCRLDSPTDSIGTCTNVMYAPTLNYPRICNVDSDCIGIDGSGYSANGTCSCGMDMHGFAYCDAFSGDPPSQTLQYLYELHVNSTGIFQCHTQRRFDIFCLVSNIGHSAGHLFTKMSALASDTARYQGNDFCAQQIFNYQFFDVGPTQFACQAYGCANLNGWENGTCITFAEGINTFAINPCDTKSQFPYCDYTKAENNKWRNVTCGPNQTVLVRYPGENCTMNSQCLSGNCTGNICIGTAQGGYCGSSNECDIGLFCTSKNFQFTCQPLIAAYEFGCGSDFDCVNYCGCRFGVNGPPGMCYPYFSLGNGNSTSCENGISLLCSTGACYGSGYSGVCTTAPVSTMALGTPCTFNGQCTGKNSVSQSFTSQCTCGYNNGGLSYCQPFLGDAPGVAFLKQMKTYFKSTGAVNMCQTARRFSIDCYQNFGNNFTVAWLNFTQNPMYIGNDQCVKSVYTYDYWSIVPTPPKPTPTPSPHPQPFVPPYVPGGDPYVIVIDESSFSALLAIFSLGFLI